MLKIGIAGLRRGGALLRIVARHPEARVVAVCDTDATRAAAVAAEYDVPVAVESWEALLDRELDAVVIATPLPCHAAHSIAALERGLHALCEVPACASLAEAESLARAARASSAVYMLAENCCFTAFIQSWRKMVADDRIGRVIYAEAEYVHDCRAIMREAGRPTWRASMPPIHYGTHSLGPLLSLAGDRCVSAVGMHTGVNVAPDLGAIDLEVGLYRTASGAVIKILCGFSIAREPSFHTYTVYGTRGCLEKPRTGDETLAFFEEIPELAGMMRMPLPAAHRRAPGHASLGGHGTSEFFMVNAWVDAIMGRAPCPIDLPTALDYTVPGLCAHLSAEEGGRPVAVPDYR